MKTLLLTGGSSGIGLHTVQLFAEKGWTVFELSRSGKSTQDVTHIDCDVTDDESVKQAISEVMQRIDHLDVVINNAGFGLFGYFVETDLEKELNMIETNITAVHILTKLYLQEMIKRK